MIIDVIPPLVFASLQDKMRSGCEFAEQGWEAGSDEEDTLTGDLGASLRRPWQDVFDPDSREVWRWRVSYKKFRSKGKSADEKLFGADGIFEIAVLDQRTGTRYVKGLLFQAKKKGDARKKKLEEQARQMERIAPGGAAILEYGPNGYSAWDAAESLLNTTAGDELKRISRLGDYLAGRFLACKVGKLGIYYDAIRRSLVVPDETEGVRLVRARIGDRIRVEVESKP
jgi:hypothetical protein